MRSLLLLALAGCVEQHAPSQVEVRVRNCYECHKPDYEAAPNHVGARSTTCTDCHRLLDWKGLFGGTHPESKFVIASGPHSDVFCAECHDPDISQDSTGGRNVSCITCHTMAPMVEKHHEVARFSWNPSVPTFCRDCHPLGLGGN